MNRLGSLKKVFLILLGIFGEAASLIFLFFIKYRTHNLKLSDLNVFYTGNFINLLISSLIIIMLLLSLFRLKKLKLLEIQIYLNSLFFSILLLLILALLLTKDFYAIKFLQSNEYEFEKVFSVLIWIIFFIIKGFSLNYLLLKILQAQRALIPKNFILISIYFGLIILFAFFKIYITSKTSIQYQLKKNEKFDAIVVFGAAVWKGNIPSPIFEGRLNKTFELFEKKYSNKIILTGSNAPYELSEAEVGKIYLQDKGISSSNIEIENKTTSTIEQVHYIKRELIEKKGLRKILVVSDGFHLPRVIEIANFLSVDIKVVRSNLRIETITNLWYRIRESVLLAIFWLFAV